jgi:putative iron-dependent peroxidase
MRHRQHRAIFSSISDLNAPICALEIDDDDAPRTSHKSLATIVDAGGNEYDILRDNMPFGRPGQREFGTYFIGYSRYLWVINIQLLREVTVT